MKPRAGITLVEVLVAITICSIGLLALLTLFPLGALEMAQSIKDDRCGHAKHNIASIANMWRIRDDPVVQEAMLNPGGNLPDLRKVAGGGESVSYPVLVDPIGSYYATGGSKDWLGGRKGETPRRVSIKEFDVARSNDPNFANVGNSAYQRQQLHRWCVSLDDLIFPKDGPEPTGSADRTPRYTYGFMLQMPRTRLTTVVDLTVVIYSGRSIEEPTAGEAYYQAEFAPAANTITLNWDPAVSDAPKVNIGTWVLDAGMLPSPRGRFHRVVGVTRTSKTSMEIEVLNPLTHGGQGGVIVMEHVVEVYDRGDF